jgi:hypothetical protein
VLVNLVLLLWWLRGDTVAQDFFSVKANEVECCNTLTDHYASIVVFLFLVDL